MHENITNIDESDEKQEIVDYNKYKNYNENDDIYILRLEQEYFPYVKNSMIYDFLQYYHITNYSCTTCKTSQTLAEQKILWELRFTNASLTIKYNIIDYKGVQVSVMNFQRIDNIGAVQNWTDIVNLIMKDDKSQQYSYWYTQEDKLVYCGHKLKYIMYLCYRQPTKIPHSQINSILTTIPCNIMDIMDMLTSDKYTLILQELPKQSQLSSISITIMDLKGQQLFMPHLICEGEDIFEHVTALPTIKTIDNDSETLTEAFELYTFDFLSKTVCNLDVNKKYDNVIAVCNTLFTENRFGIRVCYTK